MASPTVSPWPKPSSDRTPSRLGGRRRAGVRRRDHPGDGGRRSTWRGTGRGGATGAVAVDADSAGAETAGFRCRGTLSDWRRRGAGPSLPPQNQEFIEFLDSCLLVANPRVRNASCRIPDDADGKGEDEGHAAGKDEAPPWELDLTLQNGAEEEGHGY